MRTAVIAISVATLAACAGGASSAWTQASWAAQKAQDVNSGPWKLSASPLGGDGFKLKLSVTTDQLFGTAGADGMAAPDEDTLMEAAQAAAPEGCAVSAIERTEDGGAVASYDCE